MNWRTLGTPSHILDRFGITHMVRTDRPRVEQFGLTVCGELADLSRPWRTPRGVNTHDRPCAKCREAAVKVVTE